LVNGIRMAIEDAGVVTLGGNPVTIVYEDWDDASPARGDAWDPGVEKINALKAVAEGGRGRRRHGLPRHL